MAVRLLPALVRGRTVELPAWRAHQLADLPVGQHDCSGRGKLYAVDTRRFRRGLWWLTFRCAACGYEAALPAQPAEPVPAAA